MAERADERTDGQFEHELKREQAELGSAPHTDLAALLVELRRRRSELAASAAEYGGRLVAAGLGPADTTATSTPNARYERMGQIFGETARTALSCGMHVHVGVDSREDGVRALNAIRGWLPVLLALSANSPFLGGRDTGHQSYRSVVWQQWPTAGPFGTFADADDYDRTLDALIGTGAALDAGMTYFDARLSAHYPTVEIRIADVCAHVEDAAALAGMSRALVDAAVAGRLPVPAGPAARTEVLRGATWRAAKHGVDEQLLHPVRGQLVPAWDLVDELLDRVGASLDADSHAIRDALGDIARRGNGAALQRRVYAETASMAAVVDALAAATVPG